MVPEVSGRSGWKPDSRPEVYAKQEHGMHAGATSPSSAGPANLSQIGAVKLRLLGVFSRVVNSVLGVFALHLSRISRLPLEPEVWSHNLSPELLHSRFNNHGGASSSYSPWLSDKEFLSAHELIKDYTMVRVERCYELWDLGKQSINIDGAILEVGVWRGGTGCLLAMSAPEKSVYLADTFEGVVKPGEKDTCYLGGEHADTSAQIASGLLASARADNVRLLKGIFPDETGDEIQGPISLLHIDVDTYQSAKDIVEWALPRLPVGSKIIFDDYGFYECAGITRLVNESRKLLHNFDFFYNLNGHGIFVRTRVCAGTTALASGVN